MRFLMIHREGWRFFSIFMLTAFFFYWVWAPICSLFIGLSLFTLWFFRDPQRAIEHHDHGVYSPADGKICAIQEIVPPKELNLEETTMMKVSIFMSVFNIHVNRFPISGELIHQQYITGAFFNASFDKASDLNERMAMVIRTSDNKNVGFVQIAGLIARRIMTWVDLGDRAISGDRFGLIRFGSRVDVYFSKQASVCVKKGQRVKAGKTLLAEFHSGESM